MSETIQINELPATVNLDDSHEFPAMRDGITVKLTVGQLRALLVDGAPELLDTLNELSAAIGDDENFGATISAEIAQKLPLGGGQMTGSIDLGGNLLENVGGSYRLIGPPTKVTVSNPAFSLNPKCRIALVEILGAGGAGAGSNSGVSTYCSAGVGGNSGELTTKLIDVENLSPKELAITIGAGGVSISGGSGSNGGSTSVSDGTTTWTALGGKGGAFNPASRTMRFWQPSEATMPNTGDLNEGSHSGGHSLQAGDVQSVSGYFAALAGGGGNSKYGVGGGEKSGFGNVIGQTGNAETGASALGYGAGGGGAYSIASTQGRSGGNGGDGLVVIWEFE